MMTKQQKFYLFFILFIVLFSIPWLSKAACRFDSGAFSQGVSAYDRDGDGNWIRVEAFMVLGGGERCDCPLPEPDEPMRVFTWKPIPVSSLEYEVFGKMPKQSVPAIGWYQTQYGGDKLPCEEGGVDEPRDIYEVSFDIDARGWASGTYTVKLYGYSVSEFSAQDTVTIARPTYRQENCCDNSSWDNVRRCGGCCPDGNCAAGNYPDNQRYKQHDTDDVYICNWTSNQDSYYTKDQDCGPDNCSDSGSDWFTKEYVDDNEACVGGWNWANCGTDQRHWDYCDGDINHDRRCSGNDLGSDATKNCNDFDGWYGGNYRDYYCSDGRCFYGTIPAASCNISANPSTIDPGDSSRLSWSSSNANSCTASDGWSGGKSLSGSQVVSPSSTTTYTLTCTGPGGSASDSATVTVGAVPTISCTLSANPSSGSVPLNNVDLTADVTGASGRIRYKFDCTDDGTWEHNRLTTTNPYTKANLCDYSSAGTYTARAQVRGRDMSGRPIAECTTTINLGNNPPDVPQIQSPTNCIISDPTFSAIVSDPDGDSVAAYYQLFNMSNQWLAGGWGNWVGSGGTSYWKPGDNGYPGFGSCVERKFTAVAVDEHMVDGSSTNKQDFTVDKDPPNVSISYSVSPGTISQTSFTVRLGESDPNNCTGIAIGDVDYRIDGGSWQNYDNRISDFSFTGSNGHCYEFKYKAQDNCGNWSNFVSGGQVCISLSVPTLSVSLSVNPSSGTVPLNNVDLTADVSGTATGTVNYKFDCTNDGTWDHTYDNVPSSSKTAEDACDYTSAGTYTAKVYVERDTAPAATDTATITVSAAPTLSVSLSATPSSGPAPLENVVLRANVSGTAIGTINYTFYCNRSDSGTNITSGWAHKKDGTNQDPYSAPAGVCDDVYDTPGTYRAKVITERGSLAAEDRTTVTVGEPINDPPTATNLNKTDPDWCASPPAYFFRWTYSDPNNDRESRFDFQIDNNSNFSSPEVNRSYAGLSYPVGTQNTQSVLVSISPRSNYLTYNQLYYWQVRVWDSKGADSGWVSGGNFRTTDHLWPVCDFTWSPESPNAGEEVNFTDQSTCYDDNPNGAPCNDSWSWTFQDADPDSSDEQNPTTTFQSQGTKQVTLTVTDSDGFSCTINKNVRISFPLPKWKEIRPW